MTAIINMLNHLKRMWKWVFFFFVAIMIIVISIVGWQNYKAGVKKWNKYSE
jgi:hypothetical protein